MTPVLGVEALDEQSAYSDSLVEVSQTGIRFRNYYFPIGTKFVRFSDILGIEKKPPTVRNGKWRLWGAGDFRIWFPWDWRRPQRSCIFLLRLATQKIRIGFTVENPEKFMEIIKSKGVKIENSYKPIKTTENKPLRFLYQGETYGSH